MGILRGAKGVYIPDYGDQLEYILMNAGGGLRRRSDRRSQY